LPGGVAHAESVAHANEPIHGLAARDRFIASPDADPALPLRPVPEPERKSELSVERERDGSAWVKGATGGGYGLIIAGQRLASCRLSKLARAAHSVRRLNRWEATMIESVRIVRQ
jgi:hypothetical protein